MDSLRRGESVQYKMVLLHYFVCIENEDRILFLVELDSVVLISVEQFFVV